MYSICTHTSHHIAGECATFNVQCGTSTSTRLLECYPVPVLQVAQLMSLTDGCVLREGLIPPDDGGSWESRHEQACRALASRWRHDEEWHG